jgi:hypothetical protein
MREVDFILASYTALEKSSKMMMGQREKPREILTRAVCAYINMALCDS